MKSRIILTVLAALLALAVVPAHATDEHTYGKDEYAIIRDGLSPNEKLSLASHGDGEGGNENFHVWLMSEPAHRRIARLEDIGSRGILDTGPKAYYAFWSANSRHVALTYRSERHVVEFELYAIEGHRVRRVLGPGLFKDATSRDVGREEDQRRGVPEVEWKGNGRFLLKENRLFLTRESGFAKMLGAYGRIRDKRDDGSFFVEFSAEADCVVLPGGHYRIVDLRVGKFGDGDNW
jgi:hypothetical protein